MLRSRHCYSDGAARFVRNWMSVALRSSDDRLRSRANDRRLRETELWALSTVLSVGKMDPVHARLVRAERHHDNDETSGRSQVSPRIEWTSAEVTTSVRPINKTNNYLLITVLNKARSGDFGRRVRPSTCVSQWNTRTNR